MRIVKIKYLTECARRRGPPIRATSGSTGFDLFADEEAKIWPEFLVTINTGIAIQAWPGADIQIRSRSGLAFTKGIVVINSPATIDHDYLGPIVVGLYRHSVRAIDGRDNSHHGFTIEPGQRIAQLVFAGAGDPADIAWAEVDELLPIQASTRGVGGLGHTGL
ncbi:dutpase [Bacteriophage sp.]|nr:dutpase [Bacteriophage sp.]UOF80093.1 dutpase [Bacteriophage sp.]